VAAGQYDGRKSAAVGPTREGLGVDAEESRNLTRTQHDVVAGQTRAWRQRRRRCGVGHSSDATRARSLARGDPPRWRGAGADARGCLRTV